MLFLMLLDLINSCLSDNSLTVLVNSALIMCTDFNSLISRNSERMSSVPGISIPPTCTICSITSLPDLVDDDDDDASASLIACNVFGDTRGDVVGIGTVVDIGALVLITTPLVAAVLSDLPVLSVFLVVA